MKTMQTIAIYFDEPNKMDYPFTSLSYYQAYQRFSDYCANRDVQVAIVRGHSYLGDMRFACGWQFVGTELIEIVSPIKADIIYVKGVNYVLKTESSDLVVNDPILDRTLRDKKATYQAFHQFMPQTFSITGANWLEIKDQIKTDRIVLKPVLNSGGKGIIIVDRKTFNYPDLHLDAPYLAQEFIDSSAGIPGLCAGYHDLRVLIFNGEPKLSYIRLPQDGRLLSNVEQGGSTVLINIDDVPSSIMDLVTKIDAHYKNYTPRLYTADFFMGNGKPYLIETNARPGFPRQESLGKAYTETFYDSLFTLLDRAVAERSSMETN